MPMVPRHPPGPRCKGKGFAPLSSCVRPVLRRAPRTVFSARVIPDALDRAYRTAWSAAPEFAAIRDERIHGAFLLCAGSVHLVVRHSAHQGGGFLRCFRAVQ